MVYINWTSQETDYLKENYGKITAQKIGKKLNKTPSIISHKANQLNLHSNLYFHQSKENKEKLSLIRKELWQNPEYRKKMLNRKKQKYNKKTREKMSLSHIGKYPSNETKAKFRKRMLKEWQNPEYAKKQIQYLQIKPNLSERQMIQIIKLNNLPFNYVGDGKVWFKGFNPDFLSKNPKHIIEFNGEYWHRDKNKEIKKKRAYNSLGYKLLVIWGKELQNPNKVTDKIVRFIYD